jgi:hypothetical protein
VAALTVTIGDNDYAVYADIDFADEYLGGDALRGPSWTLLDEDPDKGRALVTATRAFLRLPWADGLPSIETPPEIVQQAAAMYAADIAAKPKLGDDGQAATNIKRVRAGPAEVEFFRQPAASPLPTAIWQMLTVAGLLGGQGGDAGPVISGTCSHSHFDRGFDRPEWRRTRDMGDWGDCG